MYLTVITVVVIFTAEYSNDYDYVQVDRMLHTI